MTAVAAGAEPVTAPRLRRTVGTAPLKAAGLVGAVLLWQLVSWANTRAGWYNGALVPSPSRIGEAAVRLAASGELWVDAWSSTGRVLGGLAVAIPVAVAAALLTTGSRIADVVVDPVLEALRPVPTLALLPIFILWFGIGESSKIALIAFSTFFLVYVSAVEAVRDVDPVLLRAAGSLGLNRRQVYGHVILRSIAPRVFVSVRLAMATGWFLVVGAEFIAADSGLGYLINFSRIWFRVDEMMVGAVAIGALGLASNGLLLLAERRLFPWRDRGAR